MDGGDARVQVAGGQVHHRLQQGGQRRRHRGAHRPFYVFQGGIAMLLRGDDDATAEGGHLCQNSEGKG